MPAAPEGQSRVVVGHAADHILRRVYTINKGPEAEEAPGKEELQPDNMEVEIADHAQLQRGVYLPGRLGLGDSNDIDEMEHYLHRQKGDHEANTIVCGSAPAQRSWRVF